MPRSGVIVHLSRSSLEVARCSGGRVVKAERADLDPEDWAGTWQKRLTALDGVLTQVLQRAGVRQGARVGVVFQSPDTEVELCTVQAKGSDALAAARLSLSQGTGDDSDHATMARILDTERLASGVRSHVLCARDSERSLDAVVEWLGRAGLTARALVSAEAIEIQALAERFHLCAADGAASMMYLGEHRTIIASGEAGSLRCVRALDFGYGVMIDAMARAGRAGELKSLSPGALRAWGAEALFRVGVPRRDQVIDEKAGVRAEHVLPLLQPVLQRYAVEVKQTLRFVMGDAGLVRSSLQLTGPGATIPTIAPVLSAQLEIPVNCAGGDVPGTLAMAARADLGALSNLPRNERARRDRVAFKRAVLAGAGVAVLLIAADAAAAFREQMRVRGLIDAQMPRVFEVRRDIELRKQAAEYARKVRAQEESAQAALGDRPDWAALLDELGVVTADRVRLTDLNVQSNGGTFTASIHGVAEVGDRAAGTTDPLAAYIEKLQRSPMIEGLELGSTRLGEYEGAAVKHFTITARLVSMPAAIAAAREEKP